MSTFYGKIHSISEVKQVGRYNMDVIDTVLQTHEEYKQYIPIQFSGDSVQLLEYFTKGMDVKVTAYLKGREWVKKDTGEVKRFNVLAGTQIEKFNPCEPYPIKINGSIKEIYETEYLGKAKRKKRSFVLETFEQYAQKILIDTWDELSEDVEKLVIGTYVEVKAYIKGNLKDNKVYMNINAFSIEEMSSNQEKEKTPPPAKSQAKNTEETPVQSNLSYNDDDDLPF